MFPAYRCYVCLDCGRGAVVCGRCDRGQVRCAGCALERRRASKRRARRTYRRTDGGRKRHVRGERWRRRRAAGLVDARVGDHRRRRPPRETDFELNPRQPLPSVKEPDDPFPSVLPMERFEACGRIVCTAAVPP